jgi:transcriptional regulator with XRE-family HTH domain
MRSPQVTIGTGLRTARLERGWPQARLARESGVPQTEISALERAAYANPSLDAIARLCDALDAELVLEIRPARVVGRVDQRDPGHVACVTAVRRMLERAGWMTATEVEIVSGRAHGFIDVLAHQTATGRLLVIEVKTEVRDIGALERQIGWYVREALGAARRIGWRPRSIAGLVICLATAAVDATLIANRSHLAASFPARGRAVRAAILKDAEMTGRGIVMVDPARRGASGLLGLALDGRRTPAPYRDYASFMRSRAKPAGSASRPTRPLTSES